jgi:hypothetical protein
MGYTVSVSTKSQKAKREMLAFMEENFRPASDLWEEVEDRQDCTVNGLRTDEGLAYDRGSSKLGFNYNTGSMSRYYAFMVCRWIALKVGRIRRFKKFGLPETSVPYIVYDGYESIPVLPRSKWEGKIEEDGFSFCDDYGTKPHYEYKRFRQAVENGWYDDVPEDRREELEAFGEALRTAQEVVRQEFQRLDELWEARSE